MIVLGLDSSTTACSAAVLRDGAVLARRFQRMERGQSEALIPMVAEVMAEAGLEFSALDLLAVTVGPGSFTGIRVALAAARALALAADRPLVGVGTAQAMAAAIPAERRAGREVVVAVESKRDELYLQRLDGTSLAPLAEIEMLTAEHCAARAWGPVLLTGDAAGRLVLPEAEVADGGEADAAAVAAVGALLWAEGRGLPPSALYVRPPDVTLPGPRP